MNNMTIKELQKELIYLISELEEDDVLAYVQQLLDVGVAPLAILDLCHAGMVRVGEHYETGRYAISGLIMAGEIMHGVGQKVFPYIEQKTTDNVAGKIVLGTVEGDIHFIGKDIFKTLVRGHGFTVHDLGVDVSPSRFLSAIHDVRPDIVGFSCLISSAFASLRDSLTFLKENVPAAIQPVAYIVGGRMDQLIADDIGAEYWTSDAMEGVRLCRRLMQQTDTPKG